MRIPLLTLFLWMVIFSPVHAEAEKKAPLESGVEFFNKGDYDAAIENFQKALTLNPENPAVIYNLLGLAYMKQNKSIKSALGSFEEALKINPKYAEVYFNLASAYAGPAADPALAAEYFNKTIEIDPNYSKAYFGLGWFTLTEKKDAAKSIDYFKKTLELFPDFAEAHYGLGLAYIQTGEPHLALTAISQLRAMNRNDLAAMIETALRQGEPDSGSGASGGLPGVSGAQDKNSHSPSKEKTSAPGNKDSSQMQVEMKGTLIPPKQAPANK